jgi:hypothetical protein
MISALVLVTLLSVDSLQAPPPPAASSWLHVMELPMNAMLRVTEVSGRAVRGRLKAVSEHEIALEFDRQSVNIARASVRRVETFPREDRRRSAKRGFLAGAGVGLLMGYKFGMVPHGLMFGATWGGIGAAIGALNGGENPAPIVVYHLDPNSRFLH